MRDSGYNFSLVLVHSMSADWQSVNYPLFDELKFTPLWILKLIFNLDMIY